MGAWRLVLEGNGPHHNRSVEFDADQLAAEFVLRLRNSGHVVTRAEFQQPGSPKRPEDLLGGQRSLAVGPRREPEPIAADGVAEPTGEEKDD
jgi:hypothetical protein